MYKSKGAYVVEWMILSYCIVSNGYVYNWGESPYQQRSAHMHLVQWDIYIYITSYIQLAELIKSPSSLFPTYVTISNEIW